MKLTRPINQTPISIDQSFERAKKIYIGQIQRNDSHPQKVIID